MKGKWGMSKRLYLTYREVQHIFQATAGAKHAIRDRCMILMCFIHGFRVSELIGIQTTDIDFLSSKIYVRRLKGGLSTTHPLQLRESELLHTWMTKRRDYDKKQNDWLFISTTGGQVSRQTFYNKLNHYGQLAGIPVRAHPHMLRHACGYELAEQGLDTRLIQDYLGHRNIRHTVHYTASNAARFANAWQTIGLPQHQEEHKPSFLSW
ncbi:tyrosine-type DNA invertase [Serratia quinivorans]|uniref:tyrosine-type DNA invertase n=1 Tax=Serratia quinivorans TaxID=137545 RepID=UPI0021B7B3F8|nr:tyrosine-type DNA invertase [Serratia quinivorans]